MCLINTHLYGCGHQYFLSLSLPCPAGLCPGHHKCCANRTRIRHRYRVLRPPFCRKCLNRSIARAHEAADRAHDDFDRNHELVARYLHANTGHPPTRDDQERIQRRMRKTTRAEIDALFVEFYGPSGRLPVESDGLLYRRRGLEVSYSHEVCMSHVSRGNPSESSEEEEDGGGGRDSVDGENDDAWPADSDVAPLTVPDLRPQSASDEEEEGDYYRMYRARAYARSQAYPARYRQQEDQSSDSDGGGDGDRPENTSPLLLTPQLPDDEDPSPTDPYAPAWSWPQESALSNQQLSTNLSVTFTTAQTQPAQGDMGTLDTVHEVRSPSDSVAHGVTSSGGRSAGNENPLEAQDEGTHHSLLNAFQALEPIRMHPSQISFQPLPILAPITNAAAHQASVDRFFESIISQEREEMRLPAASDTTSVSQGPALPVFGPAWRTSFITAPPSMPPAQVVDVAAPPLQVSTVSASSYSSASSSSSAREEAQSQNVILTVTRPGHDAESLSLGIHARGPMPSSSASLSADTEEWRRWMTELFEEEG